MKSLLNIRNNMRNGSHWVAVVFSLLVTCVPDGLSQSQQPAVFVEGEDLIYNVRYGMFDLGQVRIKTLKRIDNKTGPAYETVAYIDSYKNIPFVNLHAVFESVIDTAVHSHRFVGKSRDGDYWTFSRYLFDYNANRVVMEYGKRDTIVEERDTLKLNGPMQDGLSLFFFARRELFSGTKQNIPAIVKERKVNTLIDFSRKRKSVEYDFVDYPVDVVGFDGTAEFTGIFGLTGDFEGWFSNDAARIPIVAKMKVILGSVTLELMKWNRTGWSPPRGSDD